MNQVLTVSEITGLIKQTLEENFSDISVLGEISNFKAHVSGHWYFTLKDSNAQISCTMWRGMNSYVFFTPQDGMKITVTGKLSVYPPRGSYQIDVRSMKPAGVGELQAAFEKLKEKLSAEGLFDQQFKKEIPRFPSKIGIVTAIDGAAFRDMISVAQRRYPLVELVIVPTKVQGEGAAAEIAANIALLNRQSDIDVIIIGRGGGSLEDLWAFNEEIVARAVFASKIPVISGVGHEIDFTIADFTSDLRAPTPTAAMELATPSQDELFAFIDEFSYYFNDKIFKIIEDRKLKINQFIKSYGFRVPQDLIKNRSQFLDNIYFRLQNSIENRLTREKNRLKIFENHLQAYNVDNTLKRGYAIVRQDGKIVPRAENFNTGNAFKLKFFDKEIEMGNE